MKFNLLYNSFRPTVNGRSLREKGVRFVFSNVWPKTRGGLGHRQRRQNHSALHPGPGAARPSDSVHHHPYAPLLGNSPAPRGRNTAGAGGPLGARGSVCLGRPDEKGKLTAPALPVSQLQTLALWVLVEADGSKHLPLKAHAPHEPVIPPESQHTILVAGPRALDGLSSRRSTARSAFAPSPERHRRTW